MEAERVDRVTQKLQQIRNANIIKQQNDFVMSTDDIDHL